MSLNNLRDIAEIQWLNETLGRPITIQDWYGWICAEGPSSRRRWDRAVFHVRKLKIPHAREKEPAMKKNDRDLLSIEILIHRKDLDSFLPKRLKKSG